MNCLEWRQSLFKLLVLLTMQSCYNLLVVKESLLPPVKCHPEPQGNFAAFRFCFKCCGLKPSTVQRLHTRAYHNIGWYWKKKPATVWGAAFMLQTINPTFVRCFASTRKRWGGGWVFFSLWKIVFQIWRENMKHLPSMFLEFVGDLNAGWPGKESPQPEGLGSRDCLRRNKGCWLMKEFLLDWSSIN